MSKGHEPCRACARRFIQSDERCVLGPQRSVAARDPRPAARGEFRVTEIAKPFPVALNTVSKHLKTLERVGLVRRRVRGREHFFALSATPLAAAASWIDQYRAFWEPRIDALESYLREEQSDR